MCAADNFGDTAIASYDVAALHAGWYVDFWFDEAPAHPAGMDYVQIVPIHPGYYDWATITETLGLAVDANPGALWLIGNEPDRRGLQSDRAPAEYAVIYHDLYGFLKRRDPASRVAIGGIVQPTPLRLQYLDLILQEYQTRYHSKMPVDVWNIHNFILREDQTWGAGIPPGMDEYAHLGMLYEIQDNDDIEIFRQQLIAFRQWMAERGERDKPLIVSEYGVLMPPIYGFTYERVRAFMLATFDFFSTAVDDQIGYPADDNRLVQQWAWFSLNDYLYDPQTGQGFNGNLFDHDTHQITPLGLDYAAYTAGLVVPYVDLSVSRLRGQPSSVLASAEPVTVTLTASVSNLGNQSAPAVPVQFWNGDPAHGGVLLGAPLTLANVPARHGGARTVQMVWPDVPNGVHVVYVQVDGDGSFDEPDENNNLAWSVVTVRPESTFFPIILR